MSEGHATPPEVSIDQLADLRGKTEAVASLLRDQVAGHLKTVRTLLSPKRLLGKHVRGGSSADADHGDRSFDELKERFAPIAGKPFSLNKEISEDPISVEGKLELYPWEYRHKLEDGKIITMTSPMRWILAYHSGYTPAQLRNLLSTKESRRTEDVRQFVCSAISLEMQLADSPDVVRLLNDLRYTINVEKADGFGELPMVTVGACVPSFRPADSVISTATSFSGVAAFIELIDLDSVRNLKDPLREEIEAIL